MSDIKTEIVRHARANGAQVTALREQVLDIILQQPDGVIKAYHVLAQMQQQSSGQVAPPTVYRTLDFWVEQGILHKISAVNGYVLCSHARHHCHSGCSGHGGQAHTAFILVCTRCGTVDEQTLSSEWAALQKAVAAGGFQLTEEHLVLTGICQPCQSKKQKST